MTITFRKTTPADSDFVYTVKKAALGEAITQTWGWDEAGQREFHAKEFEPGQHEIIVYDSQPAGTLLVKRLPTHIMLFQIFLLPEFQGHGIGEHLIKMLIAESEATGLPIRLGVLKVNHRARAFYERLGFVLDREEPNHYELKRTPTAQPFCSVEEVA